MDKQVEVPLQVSSTLEAVQDLLRVRWQTGEQEEFPLTGEGLHRFALEVYKRGWKKGMESGRRVGREVGMGEYQSREAQEYWQTHNVGNQEG